MDVRAHFQSIADELEAVKNRVRYIIEDRSWQTDGAWKESVLRTVLARHLPATVGVGHGFVVEPDGISTEIDILLYDKTKPVLYADGSLVFVNSDSVLGIIEVKTRIDPRNLRRAVEKVACNAEFIRQSQRKHLRRQSAILMRQPSAIHHYRYSGIEPFPRIPRQIFVALYAYESSYDNGSPYAVLERLRETAAGWTDCIVNFASLGRSAFFRWWQDSPEGEPDYRQWHAYHVEQIAPAYFINNVVATVADSSFLGAQGLWFPEDGKEIYRSGTMPFGPVRHRPSILFGGE